MLTNLLHYEFKSTGRVVLPIAAGVLVLNIFTNILSHFVQNTSDRLPLAGVAMALLALASAVSLLVVLAICFFIEIQQFYRLLGERGYLMLALPVPIWQHIAAQFVKKLHHQAAQQPSAASKIQKYPPKACKQRRFHAQFASFFRFMAANLSLTHCVTRARPLMWV